MLSSLKERHVFQIAAVYVAGALGVLEVASQLVERSIMPEVTYELALVAVVTGLPAVLSGAWFHGKKGRQRITAVEYWVFGALALIWLAVSAIVLASWH